MRRRHVGMVKITAVLLCLLYADSPLISREKKDSELSNLREMSINELLDVNVVSATRTKVRLGEVPGTVKVITAREIKIHRYRYVTDLLGDLPGFDISFMQGLYGPIYRQRGLDQPENLRILVFINGVPDNNISAGSVYIKHKYSLHNVERVEVLYGPASALYGANAFTGIINIITRDGSEMKEYIEYGAGSYIYEPPAGRPGPYGDVTVGHTFGEGEKALSALVSVHWINSKGPILDQRDSDNPFESTYYYNEDYSGSRIDHNYGIEARISWNGLEAGFMRARDYNGQGTFGSGAWYGDDSELTFWNTMSNTFYGKYTMNISNMVENRSRLVYRNMVMYGSDAEYYQDEKDEYYDSARYVWYYRPDSEYSFEDSVHIKWSGRMDTVAGFFLSRQKASKYNKEGKSYSGFAFYNTDDMIDYLKDADKPDMPGSDSDNVYDYDNIAGFVQHNWRIIDRAICTLGYRYDYFRLKGLEWKYMGPSEKYRYLDNGTEDSAWISDAAAGENGYVLENSGAQWYSVSTVKKTWDTHNPRAGLVTRIREDLTLKALYGEAFRTPTVREFYSISGSRVSNADLKAEKIRTGELNMLYAPFPQGNIDFSAFYSRVGDMINLVNTGWHKNGTAEGYLDQYQNSGDARVVGFDLSLKVQPIKFLRLWGTYSFQNSRIINIYNEAMKEDILSHDGDKMPRVAAHKGNAGIIILYSYWVMGLKANIVGKRPNIGSNPKKYTPAYALLHGHAGWDDWPVKGVSCTGRVYNILNSKVRDPGFRSAEGDYYPSALPLPGRYFSFEIRHVL